MSLLPKVEKLEVYTTKTSKEDSTSANSLLNTKLTSEDFDWYSPGIRAQLFDKSNKSLVSDFVVKETDNSIHLLNCISPAWTCCFKTSRFIGEKVFQKLTR